MGSKVKTSESPCNEVHITSLLKLKQYISIYIYIGQLSVDI